MVNFKKLFSDVSNSVRDTLKKFPTTIAIIDITTIICAFAPDEFVENFIKNMWFYMMGVFAIGTLFSESFFKNKFAKLFGEIISLALAIEFRWIVQNKVLTENLLLLKIIITYMTVIPVLTIYRFFKNSGLSVKEYAIRVLSNIEKTFVMFVLANIGVLIVLLVFIELILDGNDYEIIPKALIVLFGGLLLPALIDSIADVKTETGKFMKILLTSILMPVALFLIATLYLYIIKIIVSGQLLNKSLFFILSLTFTIAIPGVILLKNYDENKSVLIISNILFYAFIPLLILQIISMNVRVGEYGLTTSRYTGYLLIAFEIIFMLLMIIKKSKYLDKILVVFAVFIVIGVLSPFNVYDVPVYSQTARITNMLEKVDSFDKLSTEEKNECKKAYLYVKGGLREDYLEEKLTKEQKEAIENHVIEYADSSESKREYNYEYLSMYETDKEINIEEFNKLIKIYDTYYYKDGEIDVNNYKITNKDESLEVTVNLENTLKEMYKAEKNNTKEDTFENVRYLQTSDENIMFYITEISVSYETYSNKYEHLSIDGYLLVK